MVVIALTVICIVPVLGAQEQNIDDWTAEHFQQAKQAFLKNELDTAADEYRLILSRKPKFAEIYLNLGVVYHQQRKYPQALEAFQQAVSLKPDLVGAQLFLGIDRYMSQDFKGALGPLQTVLKTKPNERQAGLYLALTYLALEQPEKAAQQLSRTAKYFPDDLEISYHLGEAYLEGVRKGTEFLSQVDPKSALCHWALAVSAEQKGDNVVAIQESLKALAQDPNIAELYARLGILLKNAGMTDLADAARQRYRLLIPGRALPDISSNPTIGRESANDAMVLENKETILRLWKALPSVDPSAALPAVADKLVNVALKQRLASSKADDLKSALQLYLNGDYKGASERIKPRVQNQPADWASAYLLARAYFLESDYDAAAGVLEGLLAPHSQYPSVSLLRIQVDGQLALRYFNIVVAKAPDSYLAKMLLAKSYAAAGQDKEAIAAYEEVLKLSPDQMGVHLAVGQIYEEKLNWPAAIDEFRAELALAPDNALALAHLGRAYTGARDADRAIEVLRRLLTMYPKDGQACADLGKAWALKGDNKKSIEAYERALVYDPSENSLHFRLFELYRKQGETALAERHLAAFKAGEAKKQESYSQGIAALKSDSSSH
jgi:tetratricopeptide (TPR) repeat protein